MFEPISENLEQLLMFAVLGFFIGVFYEPLRIIRLFKKEGPLLVGVQDFLFLSFAGFVTFLYTMEIGGGNFRVFYVAGEVFGAVVYFLTFGRLVNLFSSYIVRGIKWIFRVIKNYAVLPVVHIVVKILKFFKRYFVRVYNFSVKKSIKAGEGLKSNVKIVYNRITIKSKEFKIERKRRGHKNVKPKIRATVHKKS